MSVIETTMVEMPDGVKLFTVIKKPAAEGRFPVVYRRSPYYSTSADAIKELEEENSYDYAVVSQICRGITDSEGIFIPLIYERADGLATMDWIRKQPFYNGEIYPQGASYLSSVHLSYLDSNPEGVKSSELAVQDCVPYNLAFRHGIYKTGLSGSWTIRMYKKSEPLQRNFVDETFLTRPFAGASRFIFGEEAPYLEELVVHEDPNDPHWTLPSGHIGYRNAMRNLKTPILLTTAFYDLYTEGVVDMWYEIPEETRKKSALVITPYSHAYFGDSRNVLNFENAKLPGETFYDYGLKWFDYIRGKRPLNDFFELGGITYFPVFGDAWRKTDRIRNGEKVWNLYLHKDQTLTSEPEEKSEMSYLYNPVAPAHFKGGICSCFGGMQLQDPPNSRYDIKSFIGEPIKGRHLMEGEGTVKLRVKSDCPDTCFYVRLSIIKGDKTWCLRDDIRTLCYEHPDYTAGSFVELDFKFPVHSFVIEEGDRLRLDISSSCFPYYFVHTNRRGIQAYQTGSDIATNTVELGEACLSLFESDF